MVAQSLGTQLVLRPMKVPGFNFPQYVSSPFAEEQLFTGGVLHLVT